MTPGSVTEGASFNQSMNLPNPNLPSKRDVIKMLPRKIKSRKNKSPSRIVNKYPPDQILKIKFECNKLLD